jgi:hypothetical protein
MKVAQVHHMPEPFVEQVICGSPFAEAISPVHCDHTPSEAQVWD